jgi:tetratricopeptide (TPR) repeat protein
MSDPIVKGVKRSPSRPASRQATSTKNRAVAGKSARPKPLAKRSAADKAPARKATKTAMTASTKAKAAKKPAKSAPASQTRKATKPARSRGAVQGKTPVKATAAKQSAKGAVKQAAKTKQAPVKKTARAAAATRQKPVQAAPTPPAKRQPTRDEAAALRAFDRAHKEFTRGRFGEARMLYRAILDKHAGVSEVAARARTYLNIIEKRMRAESSLPRDADSLYDRGVIELNRGEYVAAQELFERALKREPEAAHIHYGLAATRARLGSIDTALESLQRALDIQPTLRIRAQHDQDLLVLRNLPDFERLIFAPRP